ncbi:MAG: DUF1622 domain-containing protein [Chthoniobacterales bacterium]
MDPFRHVMEIVGAVVDAAGVSIVVIGAFVATFSYLLHLHRHTADAYETYRRNIGRSILLGLEFLVAGDIIRTVVVAPTLENVLALGLIILIRTFLSFSLQLEIDGHWPWQRALPDSNVTKGKTIAHDAGLP